MIVGLARGVAHRAQPAGAADPYAVASQDEAYQFVPWPGAASLPAFESGQLVRTELPASVLPLLGISPADAPAGGHVIADVLYGQDGLARAVRLVSAVNCSRRRDDVGAAREPPVTKRVGDRP